VSEWTTVEKKKKESPPAIAKNKLSSRQLILIWKTPSAIDSLDLRNKINNAFASNGVKSPVIVSVTLSVKKNLVLTTTPAFNADYLLENKKGLGRLLCFRRGAPYHSMVQGCHPRYSYQLGGSWTVEIRNQHFQQRLESGRGAVLAFF